MKHINPRLLGLAWFLFILTFMAGIFTATFFLTATLYQAIHLNPPALLVQLVNSTLGLLFAGLLVSAVGKWARSRGWLPELNVFGPVIEAIQKIARGDFSVRLEPTQRENGAVGVLMKSVNDLALELNQMERLRQEFISNVSHEIQSPLTSIRGFAQALENEQLSREERHHYLGIIQAESTRLSRITENLLRLASLESDQARFEPKPYRLDKQIRDLILACEPQWMAKEIELQVSLDEISLTADEDLLSLVWLNLIHNSLKFTPPGGRISIHLQREASQCRFTIADTGAGIAEADQARIFERFYKADQARTSTTGGSGLGLSIAKKIVEMHQATLSVESQLGAGATFTVCLPIA